MRVRARVTAKVMVMLRAKVRAIRMRASVKMKAHMQTYNQSRTTHVAWHYTCEHTQG